MTDRLKLSDLKVDAKADEIKRQLILDETHKRIKELERNNAALEALLERRAQLEKPKALSNKIGARKNANFKAVSTAPSINKTPRGSAMVPVAYPTTQDLSNSTGVASAVRFNGDQAYLLDSSKQPRCKGDDQGIGGGIRSGTVNGEVKPVKGSSTVRIEGKAVVRQGDPCTMNGGNNPGIYTTVQAPSGVAPNDAVATSNPPVTLDTKEEKSAFKNWIAQVANKLLPAIEQPVEGAMGAAKGGLNTLPSTADLLLKATAEQRAFELDEASMVQSMFGMTDAAKTQAEVARKTRENASKIDLPKATMSNSAQEAGDTISMAIQLFAGGIGIAKGAASWLGKVGAGRGIAQSEAAATTIGAKSAQESAKSGTKSAVDGVKIVPRNVSAKGKYANRRDVKLRPASEVNDTFPKGWSPPYKPDTRVTEFTSTIDETFVRVHGANNMARSWMMKREAIEGLTATQIQAKYALPELPTFMSEVLVPAGTRIRTGVVNPIFGGTGNATQYELLQHLSKSAFSNTVRLGK